MIAVFATAQRLDLSGWLRGLLSAGISSFSGAITSAFGPALLDPKDFNVQNPAMMLKSAAMGAGLCGIVSMAKFLNAQPLPAFKEVTTTMQTTQVDDPRVPDKVITTVKETHLEPTGTGDGKTGEK